MELREKILQTSHELFVKRGIKRVTMDEIALTLGVSKRTIYEQFSDKKTLVKEDAAHFSEMMKSNTDSLIEDADNVIQGIMAVLRFIQGMMMVVTPNYFMDMRRYYPEAFEQITKYREMRKLSVTNMLVKRGMKEGFFRADLNVEMVGIFINSVVMASDETMCGVSNLKHGDFERDIFFAYLLGISTAEGRELIDVESEKYFGQMNLYGTEVQRFKF